MVSFGKECMQTLLSAHSVNSGFTICVCRNLSLVVDCFVCNGCTGTIQESDISEDLVVDGETYGCVKSFCYL